MSSRPPGIPTSEVIMTRWSSAALLFFALASMPFAGSAKEPHPLAHYVHQRWLDGSEAPAPVVAMAQGREGFLWLATGDGLFRFDGSRFEQLLPEADGRRHELPSTVLVTRNGDVWTNFLSSLRFAIYRQGVLRILDTGMAPSRIVQMAEGSDGSIWALTASYDAEVLRYHDGMWRRYSAADGLPKSNSTNMLVADDGALWIACSTGIVRLAAGADRFEMVSPTPLARVSKDPQGRIWLSQQDRVYAITGAGGRDAPDGAGAYHLDNVKLRGAPLFDREGNLWLTTRHDGVKRLTMADADQNSSGDGAESFTSEDGLSADVTTQAMEDREGNIWVATEGGLDKFRPATLISEPALTSPAVFGDKLLVGADGSVYIGQARIVYRARPGHKPEPIVRDVVEPESLCEASDGALWIGLPEQIQVWANGSVRRVIERPDRAGHHNFIYDCAFDAEGGFWISASGSGVHRFQNGRWQTMFPPGDHADFYPTTMVRSPTGGIIVQSGNRLISFDGAQRTRTPLLFGGGDISVLTLHVADDAVFAAGSFGLSRYRAGGAETALASNASLGSRINGVVDTPEGDIWLAYPRSLVRLRRAELERALSQGQLPPPSLSLGPGDGLVSRPHSHSQRSIVRGGDGRVWVATETGTLWMDPARIVRNPLPPSIAIRSLIGDARMYHDPASLTLPAATSKIEIDFAVLSFADPRHVRVRYMLDGFDRAWVDPGPRRQAFYTNLAPGKYRFRVIAANSDGVWNRNGTSLEFEIRPAFVQTKWFVLLCAFVTILVLWGLYRLRVVQVTARIRSRLEERTQERERIARELHDTLLQGVQGLILRFQAAADRIPHENGSKRQLEAALDAADKVVVDARDRVWDLRGHETTADLGERVEQLVAETPFDPPIPVRIVLEGRARAVDPLVAAEVAKIVREALLNVSYHARASTAEIAIGYDARHLAIRMRDDGRGIPEQVMATGRKEGHFGMVGMRERADRIGGSLTISSVDGGGTEVLLTLPARLAFARRKTRNRHWLPNFLARLFADE
ncbi:sensor histidine kinase [Lysobacter arenosi]|nr:sensor histidine kinase [Lysobacter arenosi]